MPVARPESSETRVIAHLDLDCFYVQGGLEVTVEQRKRPELRGKPVAVVQFNPWKGGGLIAVSYEARACGVTRNMRGDDAKKVCPDIGLVQVPMAHGHAYLNPYRDAGSEVVAVLSRGGICERASIDEVYLDITEATAARLNKEGSVPVESLSEEARKTHILGLLEGGGEAMTTSEWLCQANASWSDTLLACGAMIVAELRMAVLTETKFTCSAGIGHNKMLAKLTSSMHKPAQQTVIPSSYVPNLLASLPLKKIGQLGGKLGKSLQEDLGVKTPGDLLPYTESKLQELYGVNTGTWLWNIARGKNGDEVKGRVLPKSHSCGKTFAGPKALKDMTSVMYWLGEMCEELQERLDLDLEMNNRTPRLLVFHAAVHLRGGTQPVRKFPSKSCPFRYGKDKILADARVLFERGLRDFCPPNQNLSPVKGTAGKNSCRWAVTSLSIGASGMSAVPTGVNPITSFFSAPAQLNRSPPGSPPVSSSSIMLESLQDISYPPNSVATKEVFDGSSGSTTSSLIHGLEELSHDGILQQYDQAKEIISEGDDIQDQDVLGTKMFATVGDDRTSSEGETVTCTPQFGSIGSPVRRKSELHLPDTVTHGKFSVEEILVQETPTPSIATTSGAPVDLELGLIQCSPVEDSLLLQFGEVGFTRQESGGCLQDLKELPERDMGFTTETAEGIAERESESDRLKSVQMENRNIEDVPLLRPEAEIQRNSSRTFQPQISFPPSKVSAKTQKTQQLASSGSTSKPAASSKLKDFWQRDSARQAQNKLKRVVNNSWEYKQDEIDEEVLSQLPPDIQKELRDSLKLNPPRPTKRPTISDFFPKPK